MSPIRVLVVDDYAPFQRFVCSALQQKPELQIVGKASDGLEAVQKAAELQPDLILLDIGLPTLNGIEAARQIRKLAPRCKILFLSQESSPEVVQEGFELGALGFVVKARAGNELLAAVDALRNGRHFVSGGLAGSTFAHDPQTSAPTRFVPRRGHTTRSHEVQFHFDDTSLLLGFTRFIKAALLAENAVIVIVKDSHQNSLLQRLQEHEVKLANAIEQGRYLSLDVADVLSTFMANDQPDPVRFQKIAGNLVAAAAKAAKGHPPRVAACGECAPSLWAQGRAEAAVQLEQLWDGIAKTCDIDILCGYVLKSGQREQESQIYHRICGEHSSICCDSV
jgi:DNA-binding NarL/FixJ family response regulator